MGVKILKLSLSQFPEVKGVFVGGCVERGEGSSFRRKAHAHNDKRNNDSYFGWVCFRSWRRVGTYTMNASSLFDGEITKPSMLMKHEAAHILTPNHGHDDVWRKKVREIGGQINWWETKKYHQMRRRRIHTWVFHKAESDGSLFICQHDGNPHFKKEYKS